MRKTLLLLCIISITFSAKAQLFGKHWDEGSYYDLAGVKHSGLIYVYETDDYIDFKASKQAKQLEIKSGDLKSFTRKIDDENLDSFVVSKDKIFEKNPFLKVLVDNNIKLFSSTKAVGGGAPSVSMTTGMVGGGGGTKIEYHYGAGPDSTAKLNRKNFIEVMTTIMADKPETVERIKSKRLRLKDMDDLLYFYKYGLMPPAPAPDPFSGSDH